MKGKIDSGVALKVQFNFQTKDEADILRETFFTGEPLEGVAFNEDQKLIVYNLS